MGIEERQMNIVGLDVFSRLMMDRIIFMGVPVNDYVANVIQAQLLFLESTDPKRDVQMFINSPGGSVIAGLGIYDTMQYVSPDVGTICTMRERMSMSMNYMMRERMLMSMTLSLTQITQRIYHKNYLPPFQGAIP